MSGATLCASGIHKSDLWVERDSPGSLKGPPPLCCLITTIIMPVIVLHALCKALSVLDPGVSPWPQPYNQFKLSPAVAMGDTSGMRRKTIMLGISQPNAQNPVHHQMGQRPGCGSGVWQLPTLLQDLGATCDPPSSLPQWI